MRTSTPTFKRMLSTAALVAATWTSGDASAAFVTWIGTTGDWFVGTNWDSGVQPAPLDTATVNNGGTAQAGTAVNITSLGLGSAVVDGTNASGTAQIAGDLTLFGLLTAGRAVGATSVASGTLSVTGTLRSAAGSAPSWQIGAGFGGTGTGHVSAAAVDTDGSPLGSLSVGVASQGGAGVGSLTLGSGDVGVNNSVFIGHTVGLGGATAQGSLVLGGFLGATGVDRRLATGVVAGLNPSETGAGRATGSVAAAGLVGFRFVDIGVASTFSGLADAGGAPLVTASGQATVGLGGIVNASGTTGNQMNIGVARSLAVNGVINGPGPMVDGRATVGGNITGYDIVSIGRVESSGRAFGSVDLADGTLTTRSLRIGSALGSTNNQLTLNNAVVDADGRLSVIDGAVEIVGVSGALGRTEIGTVLFPDTGVATSAKGRLDLTRSSLTGGILDVGVQGGQGIVTAVDNSSIVVNSLSAGTGLGSSGVVALTDSNLAVRSDPDFAFSGNMVVGAGSGSGQFSATRSSVDVEGNLRIAPALSGGEESQGRVAIVDGTLDVGGFLTVGGFAPDSLGQLSLVNSTGTVEGFLRLGASANNGALFGDASLEIYASLLTIGGMLSMDAMAADGLETIFGIDGINRGLVGGYGAIDTSAALLAGLLQIDFEDLNFALLGGTQSFDLIVAEDGFGGTDFGSVQFLNLGAGYVVSSYGIVGVGENEEIWRVTVAAAAVPEPGTLGLALAALLSAAAVRRRRPARAVGAG